MTEKLHTWVMVGEKFSKLHTFNEDQVRAFATQAGDTNPLHHDSADAAVRIDWDVWPRRVQATTRKG